MGQVHELIIHRGIDEARRLADTKRQRQLVEAAYQVLSDDAEKLGFSYSGFALTSLPHKESNALVWRREGYNLTLLLESGHDRNGHPIGLPYGSVSRFILLFLQSEAIKTRSREIELGASMHEWLGHQGLSVGGRTYRTVRDQARRISRCRLTFYADHSGQEIMRQGGFVDGSITMHEAHHDQASLWQDHVLINEEFYRALKKHPVPLSETALKAIGSKSTVLDIYIWLAYRLHSLRLDTSVSWPSLYAQFGSSYKSLRQFRFNFLEGLQLALAAYPEARVSADDAGLVLHPSSPPVSKIKVG